VTPFLVLAVAFVVSFLDPRRPLRLLRADLLVLALAPRYFLRSKGRRPHRDRDRRRVRSGDCLIVRSFGVLQSSASELTCDM
jgi:hypothetical protein